MVRNKGRQTLAFPKCFALSGPHRHALSECWQADFAYCACCRLKLRARCGVCVRASGFPVRRHAAAFPGLSRFVPRRSIRNEAQSAILTRPRHAGRQRRMQRALRAPLRARQNRAGNGGMLAPARLTQAARRARLAIVPVGSAAALRPSWGQGGPGSAGAGGAPPAVRAVRRFSGRTCAKFRQDDTGSPVRSQQRPLRRGSYGFFQGCAVLYYARV